MKSACWPYIQPAGCIQAWFPEMLNKWALNNLWAQPTHRLPFIHQCLKIPNNNPSGMGSGDDGGTPIPPLNPVVEIQISREIRYQKLGPKVLRLFCGKASN